MIPAHIVQAAVSLIADVGKKPPTELSLASLAATFQRRPKDAALLVAVLARMASADRHARAHLAAWEHLLDETDLPATAESAHAAFNAGRQTPAIERGERLYQRLRKRDQRARKRDLGYVA